MDPSNYYVTTYYATGLYFLPLNTSSESLSWLYIYCLSTEQWSRILIFRHLVIYLLSGRAKKWLPIAHTSSWIWLKGFTFQKVNLSAHKKRDSFIHQDSWTNGFQLELKKSPNKVIPKYLYKLRFKTRRKRDLRRDFNMYVCIYVCMYVGMVHNYSSSSSWF
jgi:hypothetical protein